MFAVCAGCKQPTMTPIAANFLPTTGRPIPCLLCKGCCEQLQAGDAHLSALVELRLLLQSKCGAG